jgi:metal-dependent amidase/aminoacylase/carboxypeptidase family protein
LATGARLEIRGGDKPYAEMHFDPQIGELYKRNAEMLGRIFPASGPLHDVAASTDMGNVSLVVPSVHPMIGIDSLPAVNHQPEFAAHCNKPAADRALSDGALAMAWTAIDLAQIAAVRERLIRNS